MPVVLTTDPGYIAPNQWAASRLGNADTDRQNRVNYVLGMAQQGNIRAAQIILGAPPNVSGNERGMWTSAAGQIGRTDLGALALAAAQDRGPTWLTGNGDTASNYPGLKTFLAGSEIAHPAHVEPPTVSEPEPLTPSAPTPPVTPVTPVLPPPVTVTPEPPPPTGNTDADRQQRVDYVLDLAQRGNIRAAQIILGAPSNVSGNERGMWTSAAQHIGMTDLGMLALTAAKDRGPAWLVGNGDTASNYPGLRNYLAASEYAHPAASAAPPPTTQPYGPSVVIIGQTPPDAMVDDGGGGGDYSGGPSGFVPGGTAADISAGGTAGAGADVSAGMNQNTMLVLGGLAAAAYFLMKKRS